MNNMTIFEKFINQYDYDVRKTKDARWIDQKCTFDVLHLVSNCILEFSKTNRIFSISDIWNSECSRKKISEIFSKPDPRHKAKNEYDKYFSQPIKLLSYSKVLNCTKNKNTYFYTINNLEILKIIASDMQKSLEFLWQYILKVLIDSSLWNEFEYFFDKQDKDSFIKLKNKFANFTKDNTKIKNEYECSRIFTKILNPLAWKFKKLGTHHGYLSKRKIVQSDLLYNRENFRDIISKKEKDVPRKEHIPTIKPNQRESEKAKEIVRKYNEQNYNSRSEIPTSDEVWQASHGHHIFPVSEFPTIAGYTENIICLTQNQHLNQAHPKNHTHYIDKDYQYVCLVFKIKKIEENLLSDSNHIYDFDKLKHVLNVGLKTSDFSNIKKLDFQSVRSLINKFFNTNNKNKYIEILKKYYST